MHHRLQPYASQAATLCISGEQPALNHAIRHTRGLRFRVLPRPLYPNGATSACSNAVLQATAAANLASWGGLSRLTAAPCTWDVPLSHAGLDGWLLCDRAPRPEPPMLRCSPSRHLFHPSPDLNQAAS